MANSIVTLCPNWRDSNATLNENNSSSVASVSDFERKESMKVNLKKRRSSNPSVVSKKTFLSKSFSLKTTTKQKATSQRKKWNSLWKTSKYKWSGKFKTIPKRTIFSNQIADSSFKAPDDSFANNLMFDENLLKFPDENMNFRFNIDPVSDGETNDFSDNDRVIDESKVFNSENDVSFTKVRSKVDLDLKRGSSNRLGIPKDAESNEMSNFSTPERTEKPKRSSRSSLDYDLSDATTSLTANCKSAKIETSETIETYSEKPIGSMFEVKSVQQKSEPKSICRKVCSIVFSLIKILILLLLFSANVHHRDFHLS